MIFIPEFSGSVQHWVLLSFACSSPFLFLNEALGILSLGYSKFAKQEQGYSLPSRLGMFLIYFPPVLLFPGVLVANEVTWTSWHMLVTALMMLHFGKRCFETLFVHKYSGVMNGWTVVTIGGLYACLSALLGLVAVEEVSVSMAESAAFSQWLGLGLGVWILGTVINAYHHVLLANLRKPGETGYKLPKGGLFGLVACPHYLGEIIAWCGYMIFFRHVGAYAATLTMSLYLLGRAHNTVKWYRGRVEGVPENWKRVIPFVY